MRPDLLPTAIAGMVSHVMQEAAEVIQVGTKIQMFGWISIDPVTKIKYNNDKDLRRELLDLKLAIARLENEMKRRGM